MKLSELKEQIKELYLQEENNSVEDIKAQAQATRDLTDATKELNKVRVTMSEFKSYLRQEILAEITEQEDEMSDDVPVGDEGEIDAETFDFDKPSFEPTGEQDIDDVTDELVKLAKKAKGIGQLELANQILNSAKYSSKVQFKDVEKEV
tara:strand:+ start:652 stop:1098 length:447 start_codon:yes stop_codon:yes gene_type:complete